MISSSGSINAMFVYRELTLWKFIDHAVKYPHLKSILLYLHSLEFYFSILFSGQRRVKILISCMHTLYSGMYIPLYTSNVFLLWKHLYIQKASKRVLCTGPGVTNHWQMCLFAIRIHPFILCPDKYLHLEPGISVWSKATLNTGGVGGTVAGPPTCKTKKFLSPYH